MLTVGSICAGIGGWDLGLERAGMVTRWQVEIDPWCRRVLAKHFPDATRYEDAHAVDYAEVEYVDVIAAGYPCQPFSVAGRRAGFDDPRNVWPAVARAVRDIRPRFVLLENVAGHLALGFGDVLGDLAALGYRVEWDVLPAAAFGAPHVRERVWLVGTRADVADADGAIAPRRERRVGDAAKSKGAASQTRGRGAATPDADGGGVRHEQVAEPRRRGAPEPSSGGAVGATPDAGRARCEEQHAPAESDRERQPRRRGAPRASSDADGREPVPFRAHAAWAGGPTESPIRGVDDGLPVGLDRRRLKALGNALVPQIAEYLGRRVVAFHESKGTQ